MEKTYLTKSTDETWQVANEILKEGLPSNIILLQGELGAGKTTFAQGMLQSLGAQGPFTSPTFVILKRYELGKTQIANSNKQIKPNAQYPLSNISNVYHLDCYRVVAEDILELGWDEIISDPRNLVMVEWSERIKKIWPDEYLLVDFENVNENERKINLGNVHKDKS